MITYMFLGAYLLILLALGLWIASTGIPDVNEYDSAAVFFVWTLRVAYLCLLAYTMFELGIYNS